MLRLSEVNASQALRARGTVGQLTLARLRTGDTSLGVPNKIGGHEKIVPFR